MNQTFTKNWVSFLHFFAEHGFIIPFSTWGNDFEGTVEIPFMGISKGKKIYMTIHDGWNIKIYYANFLFWEENWHQGKGVKIIETNIEKLFQIIKENK